jgi:Thioesterase-like superfamily
VGLASRLVLEHVEDAECRRPELDREFGPVTVRAQVERRGRSLTSVSGRALDESPMPEVEPAEARGKVGREFPRDDRPPFAGRLTMQHRFGDPPFTGSDRGEVGGWRGLLERRPVDALTISICADAWFPAPWPRLTELAPAPTVDLTIYFRAPLPLDDSLLLGRFRSRLVRDGFFEQDGELWAPNGTLVAQSRQLGLLIDPQL